MTDFDDATITNTESDNDPDLKNQIANTLKFHLQTQNNMKIQNELVINEPDNNDEDNTENSNENPTNPNPTNQKYQRKNRNNQILIPDFFMHYRLTKLFPHLFSNTACDWTARRPRLITEKESMHRILYNHENI